MPTVTLSFKGRKLKVFPMERAGMVVGSAPECEIVIDSLAVDLRHARLLWKDGDPIIEDLDSAGGTFVNSERVQRKPLRNGDVIRIGKHSLLFTADPLETGDEPLPPPPPLERPERPKSAWLQILTGANVGKTISLSRKMTNIGRPGVQTAVIARRNGGFYLSHLEGTTPPRVDGVDIGEHSRLLEDRAIIQLGNVKMQFYFQ